MKVPFKCAFCPEQFAEFENYKKHLKKENIPKRKNSVTSFIHFKKKYLKCEICKWTWLFLQDNIIGEGDALIGLSSFQGKRLCDFCISETVESQEILRNFCYYFQNITDMSDLRYKDLYVKCYREGVKCCLCQDRWGPYMHDFMYQYMLPYFPKHVICDYCFAHSLDNEKEHLNCNCGLKTQLDVNNNNTSSESDSN
jgi:hypothetical protein